MSCACGATCYMNWWENLLHVFLKLQLCSLTWPYDHICRYKHRTSGCPLVVSWIITSASEIIRKLFAYFRSGEVAPDTLFPILIHIRYNQDKTTSKQLDVWISCLEIAVWQSVCSDQILNSVYKCVCRGRSSSRVTVQNNVITLGNVTVAFSYAALPQGGASNVHSYLIWCKTK